MQTDDLKTLTLNALEELKAQDLTVLDVRGRASFTDLMILATGTSDRHVKALASNVDLRCREAGVKPLGMEGEREGEWVLLDLGDVIVHVMRAQSRAFYNLERLWGIDEAASRVSGVH